MDSALTVEITAAAITWQRGLDAVRAMAVDSQESYQRAGELCRLAKANHKALDDKRTGITKPLLVAKKAADDLFRAPLQALEAIEQELKTKMGQYQRSVAAARERVMAESAAQHAAGLVPTAPVPAPAAASGVAVKEVLDFEIVDPAAVPRRYCSPDPAVIREVLRVAGDIVEIPGVRVFKRSSVMVRS